MPSNPPELHLPSAASCVGWMGASRRDRASSGEKGGGGEIRMFWKHGWLAKSTLGCIWMKSTPYARR